MIFFSLKGDSFGQSEQQDSAYGKITTSPKIKIKVYRSANGLMFSCDFAYKLIV